MFLRGLRIYYPASINKIKYFISVIFKTTFKSSEQSAFIELKFKFETKS